MFKNKIISAVTENKGKLKLAGAVASGLLIDVVATKIAIDKKVTLAQKKKQKAKNKKKLGIISGATVAALSVGTAVVKKAPWKKVEEEAASTIE